MKYLYVAVGSAAGGVLRLWLGSIAARWLGAPHFGTILVNVSGSFAIGFLAARGPTPVAQQLLMIGVLGGYTTFSSFSLQTLELVHEGRVAAAAANVGLSVALSLLAVWLGHGAGTWWQR